MAIETDKFGLTDDQKMRLTSVGLTKEEIKMVNDTRISKEIADARSKLDKLESKLSPSAKMPDGATGSTASSPSSEPTTMTPEEQQEIDEATDQGDNADWANDLPKVGAAATPSASQTTSQDDDPFAGQEMIMTNKEYFAEVQKALAAANAPELPMDEKDPQFDQKFNAYLESYVKAADPIMSKRQMGYYKALADFQNGNGQAPEPLPENEFALLCMARQNNAAAK